MMMDRKISVIGLGYVGLPVAVAFAGRQRVIAFDINPARLDELRRGYDRTGEVDGKALKAGGLYFTDNPEDLGDANFHIIAVPTPIDDSFEPDLSALVQASAMVGSALSAGDIVVYESTVYPGATEEICMPELERASGLNCGKDFSVGYSPERINPGDREHTFSKITKVVSGQDAETLEVVARVYEGVVDAGVHRAPSIRTAEAAKVIENTQRDLNIALMNELSIIFDRMGLATEDVLKAARTKWNFLPFRPGLVGGHCIGVDPYYLTFKSQQLGYHPEVILSGRKINDGMAKFVAEQTVRRMQRMGIAVKGGRATVLGVSFKEDVPDLRNSKVADLIEELKNHGLLIQVSDPLVDEMEAKRAYGLTIVPLEDLEPAQVVIAAVAHRQYRDEGWPLVKRLLMEGPSLVVDIQGMVDRESAPPGTEYWRL